VLPSSIALILSINCNYFAASLSRDGYVFNPGFQQGKTNDLASSIAPPAAAPVQNISPKKESRSCLKTSVYTPPCRVNTTGQTAPTNASI
jgi:hypothetical protein